MQWHMNPTRALVVSLLAFGAVAQAQSTRFAQGNFFITKNQLSAVNYRQGTLLPVGAKVQVLKESDDEVKCKVVDSGAEFTFVSHKSLGRTARDLFKGFFNEQDPAPRIAALPAEVQRAVRAGELLGGMTRDAVLLSMGPPPPHKTASLEAPRWLYWTSKMGQLEVNFNAAGQVESFGEPGKAEKKPFLGGLFEKKPEAPKEYFFSRCNLHHEEATLSWVNYQVGPVIPFNTKVELVDKGSSAVKFKVAGEATVYTFENDKRSGKDVWALFTELFAPEDQASALAKLSEADRKQVAAVEVAPGMSRLAVRMAWGPPPPHATPAFESSTWTYWKTKLVKVAITFKDDKVVSVQ
jgi:outer membrane protein assembly factor BamE (lipoprotein component of BamABCDE complex)